MINPYGSGEKRFLVARSLRNRALAHGGKMKVHLIPLIEQISNKRTLANELQVNLKQWKKMFLHFMMILIFIAASKLSSSFSKDA